MADEVQLPDTCLNIEKSDLILDKKMIYGLKF